MLYLLGRSVWSAVTGNCAAMDYAKPKGKSKSRTADKSEASDDLHRDALLFRLALPQLALVGLALTTFHVQIITRLSSGYPLWYLLLARDIVEGPTVSGKDGSKRWWQLPSYRTAMWTVRWMILYALIQGVLFASFLPPA
jgi:phosphatidylinositol glycan class V